MSQKQYTTEQIVRLYHQYAPKEVMYKGEKVDVRAIGVCRNNILADARNKNLLWWVGITDCRLILRPVSALTEQELQELAGVIGACKIEIICNENNECVIKEYWAEYKDDFGNWAISEYITQINEKLPLNIAQFLFYKQINFLNLPADIAVEQ